MLVAEKQKVRTLEPARVPKSAAYRFWTNGLLNKLTVPAGAGTLQLAVLTLDQVIREDPAVRSSCVRGRGTETSAEVLVGPPWRMESNAGQQLTLQLAQSSTQQ